MGTYKCAHTHGPPTRAGLRDSHVFPLHQHTHVHSCMIHAQIHPQIHGKKMNITSLYVCLAQCPWDGEMEFKEGFGRGELGVTQGQESLPALPGPRNGLGGSASGRPSWGTEGSAPCAPHLGGDEAWGLQNLLTQGFCSCTASAGLLPPCLVLLLAPEPSNLAGKDKHKPCVPTPMDLTTRQQFPGPSLDFRIWEEEWGMVCMPGDPVSESPESSRVMKPDCQAP